MGSGIGISANNSRLIEAVNEKYQLLRDVSDLKVECYSPEIKQNLFELIHSLNNYVTKNKLTLINDDMITKLEMVEENLESEAFLRSLQTVVGEVSLSCEGLSLDNLSIAKKLGLELKGVSLVSLNASNNILTDKSIEDYLIFAKHNQTRLQQINISNNQISSLLNICIFSSRHLLFLDVSYCEDLVFERNCFVFCPQLIVLRMDSCNISSTTHKDNGGLPDSSIFFGLVRLEELSLKENQLEDVSSCEGLFYFGFSFFTVENKSASAGIGLSEAEAGIQSSTDKPKNIGQTKESQHRTTAKKSTKKSTLQKTDMKTASTLIDSGASVTAANEAGSAAAPLASTETPSLPASRPPLVRPISTLKKLFLLENEVHSSLSQRRLLIPRLREQIPSLELLDEESLHPVGPGTVTRDIDRQLLRRREADDQRSGLTGPLGEGGLDAMEKEYIAALRGERDTSVVS